jgi:cyclopropane fatty-acyl-phospholipid synthase-like methyltransferase
VSEEYREFYYPLNVFMHILTQEEGGVTYLHYGLFERPDEPIGTAQEHSTELLLSRLPAPPAKILDVGIGVGTTLAHLRSMKYDVTGITPDAKQIAMVKARYGDSLKILLTSFEELSPAEAGASYDCVVFQESSQYIQSHTLFAKARGLTGHVVVLDEFASKPVDTTGSLHSLPEFLDAAEKNGFRKTEESDLSARAAPTIDYFRARLPRFRDALIADLGITSAHVDELIESGERYRANYDQGLYVYRLLQFRRDS